MNYRTVSSTNSRVPAWRVSHSKPRHFSGSSFTQRTPHHREYVHAHRVAASSSEARQPSQQPNPDDAVQAALQKVTEAAQIAEQQLHKLEELPSARVPRQTHPYVRLLIKVVLGAIAVTLAFQSQLYARWVQFAGAAVAGCAVAVYGLSKNSLDPSGAMTAAVAGACTIGCSWRVGITLLAFFGASSRLTHFRMELKDVDESHRTGGQRDWQQVLCNALIPAILSLVFGFKTAFRDVPLNAKTMQVATAAMGGCLGYFACCCADTWASELGQLSSEEPRLITSWRPVRKGTNGGVTLTGLAASLGGGLFMGLVFWSMGAVSPTLYTVPFQQEPALGQWSLILLGGVAGLLGSLLDSLLGATLQFTGFNRVTQKVTSKLGPDVVHISGHPYLTNNLVNLVSAAIIAGLTAWAALKFYWF